MSKNKLLLLLVLLVAVVTGAWAQTETLLTTITATAKDTYSETTAGVVTVTPSGQDGYNTYGWSWRGSGSVTVEAKEGYTITKCVFSQPGKTPVTISSSPFAISFNGEGYCVQNDDMDGVKSIEVYGYVTPAATGYKITLDEGTGNKDSQNWEIKPKSSELGGGEAVTVKYNGSREVKSVTVVKKVVVPDPIALSAVTADNIGSVVTSDGNVYPAKTALPAGKTAVGILGKVTATGHGLIIALQDAAQQNWNTINGWTSVTTYAGTTLKVLPNDAARSTNLTSYAKLGSTAVSNWAVAQKSDYDAIFTNLGSKTGDSDGTTYDANVNAYITTGVGGTALSGEYWSATVVDDNLAWNFTGSWWSYQGFKDESRGVRPVLGF